jgi:hypothetical protein
LPVFNPGNITTSRMLSGDVEPYISDENVWRRR